MFALRPAAASAASRGVVSAATRVAAARSTGLASASLLTSRDASTLVVSEPTHSSALPASTLSAITAATKLDGGTGDITLLTISDGSHPPIDPSSIPASVKAILNAKVENGSLLAETVSEAVKAATSCGTFSHVLAASTKFGANFVPRAGALLGVSPVPDVVEILDEGEFLQNLVWLF